MECIETPHFPSVILKCTTELCICAIEEKHIFYALVVLQCIQKWIHSAVHWRVNMCACWRDNTFDFAMHCVQNLFHFAFKNDMNYTPCHCTAFKKKLKLTLVFSHCIEYITWLSLTFALKNITWDIVCVFDCIQEIAYSFVMDSWWWYISQYACEYRT